MTIVEKQYSNDNYYVSMELKNNVRVIQVCPIINDNLCGYPIRSMTYPVNEEIKAMATFKRYVKKYI